MIFFTGCPLHCQFCQNRQISGSDGENYGIAVSEEEMSGIMLSLQDMGAATLNLVTGTHFIPSIIRSLEEARERGLSRASPFSRAAAPKICKTGQLAGSESQPSWVSWSMVPVGRSWKEPPPRRTHQ